MNAKKIVQNFYNSDAFVNEETMNKFLHKDLLIEWNSTKGFVTLNKQLGLDLTKQMAVAYTYSRIDISHIFKKANMVTVRYSHFVKTIENPNEEMLLAHFMAIWEIKDKQLYKGFQMSQIH
jgi:hypothetical protein